MIDGSARNIDAASAAQARAFFEAAGAIAERATTGAAAVHRSYAIGGFRFDLSFSGASLCARLAPAFEHLRCESQSAARLHVRLFDSAAGAERLPPRPWPDSSYRARCEVEGWSDGRYRASVSAVGRSVSLLDVEEQQAIYWIEDADAVPHYETGAPLLAILHWWLGTLGLQLVHAGAVGTGDGAVLLVGKGGSGKSTTALSCIGSELGYLGDDYCVVDPRPPARVLSLYATGKLHIDNSMVRPLLRQGHTNAAAPDEKRVYALAPLFRSSLLAEAPVRAIVVPCPSGKPGTTWGPIPRSRALAAAAPSTVLQLPGAGRDAFRAFGDILRQVPALALLTGTDLEAIPVAIGALLRELS